jgi:arsenate reductase
MKTKVLFVCIGNACRSQMAEAFARAYGADVLDASSAGVSPASNIPDITRRVMMEKGISLDGQYPKDLLSAAAAGAGIVVNMSGVPLPGVPAPAVRDWKVEDPIGKKDAVHERVRDEIENLVMNLILELRRRPAGPPPPRRFTR